MDRVIVVLAIALAFAIPGVVLIIFDVPVFALLPILLIMALLACSVGAWTRRSSFFPSSGGD